MDYTEIKQLTPSISRLTQLICLKGDSEETLAPNWIGKLSCLEELQVAIYFPNGSEEDHARGFLKALGSLKELRVFRSRIYDMDERMQQDLVLSLRNLHKLQHLEFWCNSWIDADTAMWREASFHLSQHLRILHLRGFKFSSLPSCISDACLPKLTHLSLHVDAMDQKGLEFLSRLPELCYLCLLTESTVTISNINASNGYFRKLRICWMPESMIQFICQEGHSSVSFNIWNGIDAMPFGCGRNSCNVAPSAAMPNLEVLHTRLFVRAFKDGNGDSGNIGLQFLTSLQELKVYINCEYASVAEVDEVQAALRNATEVHINSPTLLVYRWNEDKMISTVQDEKSQNNNAPTDEQRQKQQECGANG